MKNLDDLISYSISKVIYPDKRKKLANNILICGGGSQLPGMIEEIEDRLIDRISHYDPSIERTEVIDTESRDIDPIATTWVGASVIPKLDIMKEYWIRRNKYLGNIIKKTRKPTAKNDIVIT